MYKSQQVNAVNQPTFNSITAFQQRWWNNEHREPLTIKINRPTLFLMEEFVVES